MGFGQNLQFLRKMHEGMTQEELAEKMGVSRQTVSKWEMESAFPEMEKAMGLCRLFACSLDELLMGSICSDNEAYQNIRIETIPAFRYVRYAVISSDPETDANRHLQEWAAQNGIEQPRMIGWDFPFVSQEQTNVYHMHGYTCACVLPQDFGKDCGLIMTQPESKYAALTIKEPFANPFVLIPNAYKTLMRYLEVNGFSHREEKDVASCFEEVYEKDGACYMDVFIAVK